MPLSKHITGTLAHKRDVGRLLTRVIGELSLRAVEHDTSKFSPEEFDLYEEWSPLLGEVPYRSPEYDAILEKMGPAVEHHYEVNGHHPQNHAEGVTSMTLIDVLEMLVDWMAATRRHGRESVESGVTRNCARFEVGDQLARILLNTMDWLAEEEWMEE